MYTPPHYKNENIDEVREFIKANSFGILVSQTKGRLWGTHIPMELDFNEHGNTFLYSHISKANPQWKSFVDGEEVLAIFHGPHSYVSSSWYQKEDVPTWNYIAVHVYGKVEIIEGKELIDSLKKLVDTYEHGSEHPVSVENLSEKTMRQVNGIVGFKIAVSEIQATYKLSQTRKETDFHTIVNQLENSSDFMSNATAKAMKQSREKE
ncbi:FMN-binding negative transcriptional regulator [Flavobacterium lindanitolerans]|uniref:Transcriptional regulator n=1 Tax=Flavobacterium lindanitolerans TaxID=428988 RepID=A0A497UXF0_9FLAO|nr:FMN-binding negative transcriptional regulator [Flavobacterium lindanitolerans]PKW29025.1 PaiB family negative transcriptional regulator [Flavobacterium lindanitolerans]RLJ35472.1 transcriptional regulator [Flavobacterium lindanitolerans]